MGQKKRYVNGTIQFLVPGKIIRKKLESFLEKLLAQPNLIDSEQEPSDRPSMTI
jgi:hypothetical protein